MASRIFEPTLLVFHKIHVTAIVYTGFLEGDTVKIFFQKMLMF